MESQMEAQYQPQRPETRPRSKSSFSFRSQKSDKSTGSKPKLDLVESHSEKLRSKFNQKTKANPNSAINEDQPATRAQMEQATLSPLRSIQHKDWSTGTVITDPDASNPSRSRMERPLDTIRSFEVAADGRAMRRAHAARTESGDALTAFSSRRSSVVGGYDNYHGNGNNPRYAAPGDLDSPRRQSAVRPNYDYGRGPPNSYPRRGMGQRMSSAPIYGRGAPEQLPHNNQHGYHESYDTTYAGDSSQSEPWGNSTDPSSENSSLDRIHAAKHIEPSGDAYGGQYRQGSPLHGPIREEGWQAGNGRTHPGQHYNNRGPSPNPAQQLNGAGGMRNGPPPQQYAQQPSAQPRQIIKLTDGDHPQLPSAQRGQNGPTQQWQPPPPVRQRPPPNTYDSKRSKLEKREKPTEKPTEKRKSWLKRTFSKG